MNAQPTETDEPGTELPAVEPDVITAEPEPEPEPAPEPEPELEPTTEPDDAPLSEKQIESLQKKLDNEAKRHASAVGRIMGDDATALVKCEACDENIPGFHWPADVFPPDSAERALYEMLSGGGDAQMPHPAYFERCDECNGFTQVLTGARVGVTQTLPCPKCKGQGYLDLREREGAVVTLAPVTASTGEPATPAEGHPSPDMNGRPSTHPRYGKLPNFLTRAEWEADRAEGFDVGDTFYGIPG